MNINEQLIEFEKGILPSMNYVTLVFLFILSAALTIGLIIWCKKLDTLEKEIKIKEIMWEENDEKATQDLIEEKKKYKKLNQGVFANTYVALTIISVVTFFGYFFWSNISINSEKSLLTEEVSDYLYSISKNDVEKEMYSIQKIDANEYEVGYLSNHVYKEKKISGDVIFVDNDEAKTLNHKKLTKKDIKDSILDEKDLEKINKKLKNDAKIKIPKSSMNELLNGNKIIFED